MLSGYERLDPKYKIEFKEGDRVTVTLDGDLTKRTYNGTIIGISTRHIIDAWIVMLDEYPEGHPFKAVTLQHTFIKREGSNGSFLCDFTTDPIASE